MGRRAILASGLAAGLAGLLPARLAAQALRQGATSPGLRLAPDQEAMVPVTGGRIYVRVNGALGGKPPILFIHGGPGSSHWSWLNATALADGDHFYRIDFAHLLARHIDHFCRMKRNAVAQESFTTTS